MLVIKGGPITPDAIRKMKARDAVVVNFFPDNPLWMIPFDRLEAYDLFFTKERYALRTLASVGLRNNLHYLPMYCVPAQHHPVTLTDAERARYGSAVSLVGSQLTLVALPWFVLQITGSPTQTGLTGSFLALPQFISGILGGAVIDRLGYRRVSLAADMVLLDTRSEADLAYHYGVNLAAAVVRGGNLVA